MQDTETGRFTAEALRNPTTGEEIISALNNDIRSSEWALSTLHRNWYESIFWFYGEQYLEWSYRNRRFQVRQDRAYIPRSTTNLILPKVEIGIALFKDSLPRPRFVSTTREERDRAAAAVANPIMRFRDQEGQVERKKGDISAWTVVTGNCFAQAIEDKANAQVVQIPVMERVEEPVLDRDGTPIPGPEGLPLTVLKERAVMDPETGQYMKDRVVLADEGVTAAASLPRTTTPTRTTTSSIRWSGSSPIPRGPARARAFDVRRTLHLVFQPHDAQGDSDLHRFLGFLRDSCQRAIEELNRDSFRARGEPAQQRRDRDAERRP